VGGFAAVTTLFFLLVVVGPIPDAGADGGSATDGGVVDAGNAEVFALDAAPDAPSHGAGVRTAAGRLHGRVLAKGSRGPVSAAKIVAMRVDGSALAGEAGDDGSFDLPIPCGPSALTVRAPGFDPLVLEHDACATSAPLVLRLVPRPNLPVYETVVVAARDEPSVALRGPELVTTPGSLGDPFRTIESLPGVATVAWPAPIYAIRGSNPGNTGYFLDDVQVPLLFHLALGPSVIHPAFFDSMAFYPGGYPVRYGRYAAGIVTSQTRAPAEDRVHAAAEVRLYDAGGMLSTPWPDGNGGVAAAFRYSYTGALLSLLRNDLRLNYWDYQLRADRRVRGWALSLLLFGSGDDLAYRLNPGDPEREYLLRFHRASLRASRSVGQGRLSASLAVGADHSTAPIVQNFPITANATSIIPRASYLRKTARVDYEVGVDGQAQWLRPMAGAVEAGASDLARARTAVLWAGYTSASIRATERLSLTPGLRLDSYTISGVTKADLGPRLSARLVLDEKTWVTGSSGRFSQAPSLTVQIPAAENFGLALYGLQTAWQGSLGFGTRRVPGVEVEVTGYIQRYVLTDLRDPALINPDPLASDFLVRRDARSYGMEILIRRPASERLHGWISYTLSQSQRALGGVIGPSDWDQRHILNAVLGYRLGRYELGARGHLNTGRPVLVNGGQAETFVRLPTFYQLDLRAERRILFDTFTLNAYVELVNATLSREVYELDQQPSGELSQRSLRVVLPAIGIRGEL
jgi:hypothetical protein